MMTTREKIIQITQAFDDGTYKPTAVDLRMCKLSVQSDYRDFYDPYINTLYADMRNAKKEATDDQG